jgi:hypothetical protein
MMTDFAHYPKLRPMWHTPCYDKLCVLDWPYGFSVVCYGVRIALRSNSAELLEQLRNALPVGCKPYDGEIVDHVFSAILGGREEGSRVRKFHMLYGNHDLMFRHRDLEPMFPAFDSAFRLAVAALAPKRIFVHAGVVAWNGAAIVLPGRSMTGKTTLVAELLRAGASYLSDEYAVLDSAGRVHPFQKPLAIRADSSIEQVETPPRSVGREVGKAVAARGSGGSERVQGERTLAAQDPDARPRCAGDLLAHHHRLARAPTCNRGHPRSGLPCAGCQVDPRRCGRGCAGSSPAARAINRAQAQEFDRKRGQQRG